MCLVKMIYTVLHIFLRKNICPSVSKFISVTNMHNHCLKYIMRVRISRKNLKEIWSKLTHVDLSEKKTGTRCNRLIYPGSQGRENNKIPKAWTSYILRGATRNTKAHTVNGSRFGKTPRPIIHSPGLLTLPFKVHIKL